jgi:hypothetical protein
MGGDMRPEELRIGNLILDRGNKILQIDRFYGNRIECDVKKMPEKDEKTGIRLYYHPYTEEITFCQPIPLTEEWLVKLGFELHYGRYFKGNFCYYPENKMFEWRGIILLDFLWNEVHKLQNLYFALTGEELKIK